MAYDGNYQDYQEDSDADDEYERSLIASPRLPLPGEYESSPTESDPPSNENTPTTYTHSGTNHTSPTGLITDWTADQCAYWVASLGFDQYGDAIVDEAIDGEALVALQHPDLKDVGITSVGHRLTILKAIYEVKIKQNVAVDADHYVPPSADANAPDKHATQDDIARILAQLKLRDERVMAAEAELRILREDLNRFWDEQRKLREDTLPLIRQAKDRSHPLPTPEGLTHEPNTSPRTSMQPEPKVMGSLARKFSTKKLHLGGAPKIPSPTIHETSSLDPSAAAMAASSHLTASMSSAGSAPSPHLSQQPSPTSPPPPYGNQGITSRPFPRAEVQPPSRLAQHPSEDPWTWSNASTLQGDRDRTNTSPMPSRPPRPATSTKGTTAADDHPPSGGRRDRDRDRERDRDRDRDRDDPVSANADFMKSFRVSGEEPCYKVLPVALRKYNINDDWRRYSLYIVHGDQERCLGLNEKPLILFKQLATEGKKPMFMLRKHATPSEGYPNGGDEGWTGVSNGGGGGGGVGGGGGGSSLGVPAAMGAAGQGRVQSYVSAVQLPGGVL